MSSEAERWIHLVAFVLMVANVMSHEAANPLLHEMQPEEQQHVHRQQQHEQPLPPAEAQERFRDHGAGRHQPIRTIDRNSVHDEEHLKEHLDGHVNAEEKLSDEEVQFRYFKVHDYDGNNKLDGIELIKALTHHHKNEGKEERISDDELSSMINDILSDNDHNQDGYIDYAEFIVSQRNENS